MQKHVKIAAIFDHNTNMRHDLMFVNAVKSVNRVPGLLQGVTLVSPAITSSTHVLPFLQHLSLTPHPPFTLPPSLTSIEGADCAEDPARQLLYRGEGNMPGDNLACTNTYRPLSYSG